MPLEYVISKTGSSLLVVDRHVFQKHTANPSTGRISWRCTKRRNKEISCSSSCSTNNDEVLSGPTPHDPACQPLTNAEFMAFDERRDKLNARQMENNPYHPHNGTINDCTISQIFDDSYNGDSLQNNQADLDEEEAICSELTEFNNEANYDANCKNGVKEEEEEEAEEATEMKYTDYENSGTHNNNNDVDEEEEEDQRLQYDDMNESVKREVSSESGSNWTKGVSRGIAGNETSIDSPVFKKIANENKNLTFVSSKSGHPMLLVDGKLI